MTTHFTHASALELLMKYNKEPFHIQHGLTVGYCMSWFANELGYGDEADFWGSAVCSMILILSFILSNM